MEWTQCSMSWRDFCNENLNLPGTQVEVKWKDHYGKKQKETFLIGDINTIGGVCDDCTAFDRNAIVCKYRKFDFGGEANG